MLTNPLGFHTPVNPPEFWEDDELAPSADDGADDYYDWYCETYRFGEYE